MEKGKVFRVNGISENGNFDVSFHTKTACNRMQALLRLERVVGKITDIYSVTVNPSNLLGKELIEL